MIWGEKCLKNLFRVLGFSLMADVGGWWVGEPSVPFFAYFCFFFVFSGFPKKSVGCWLMWVVGGWASRQEETDFPDGGSSPAPPPSILPPSLPKD